MNFFAASLLLAVVATAYAGTLPAAEIPELKPEQEAPAAIEPEPNKAAEGPRDKRSPYYAYAPYAAAYSYPYYYGYPYAYAAPYAYASYRSYPSYTYPYYGSYIYG